MIILNLPKKNKKLITSIPVVYYNQRCASPLSVFYRTGRLRAVKMSSLVNNKLVIKIPTVQVASEEEKKNAIKPNVFVKLLKTKT